MASHELHVTSTAILGSILALKVFVSEGFSALFLPAENPAAAPGTHVNVVHVVDSAPFVNPDPAVDSSPYENLLENM